MLYRKLEGKITQFLQSEQDKILVVDGARQVGKSFIIRHVCKSIFKNYVEVNLREDKESARLYAGVRQTSDLYLQLSISSGNRLGDFSDTIVFLDEIQEYPHLLTMLKFLRQEKRYRFIASGSLLGVALADTGSVPIGSIDVMHMYPLDFEEFLMAMGTGEEALLVLKERIGKRETLEENLHNFLMKRFREYLIVGGLPEAVNSYIADINAVKLRRIQKMIHELYKVDCSKYDVAHKLVIQKVYSLLPSLMENKKQRIVVKDIESKAGKQFSDYLEEFDYLTASGVAIEVRAISNPKFPLGESEVKNLLKLYMNDVGILSYLLFNTNVNAILKDDRSINLGNLYETAVAQELAAHGYKLRYYDNKKKGEVDFLVDNYDTLSVLPIEMKSGKDYREHSALDNFLSTPDYNIKEALVLSNEREVQTINGITYMPVYSIAFLQNAAV